MTILPRPTDYRLPLTAYREPLTADGLRLTAIYSEKSHNLPLPVKPPSWRGRMKVRGNKHPRFTIIKDDFEKTKDEFEKIEDKYA